MFWILVKEGADQPTIHHQVVRWFRCWKKMLDRHGRSWEEHLTPQFLNLLEEFFLIDCGPKNIYGPATGIIFVLLYRDL